MRALRPLAFVALAALVGAVAGAIILRARDSEPPPGRGSGPSVRATTSIAPRVQTFGDPVTAAVDMVFDRRVVAPDSIRIDARFAPWEQVGPARRVQTDAGNLVRQRYLFTLACVTTECAPSSDKEQVELESARIVYTLREIRSRAVTPIQWPSFDVVSRLGPFDVEQARWRADVRTLPAVSYAVRPRVLAALLGALALLLAAAAAVLVWRLLPRGRPAPAEAEPADVTPLDRALDAVALTSANGSSPQQRKALERLARELGVVGQPALAGRARRLAWSPERPGAGELDELQRDVRSIQEEAR